MWMFMRVQVTCINPPIFENQKLPHESNHIDIYWPYWMPSPIETYHFNWWNITASQRAHTSQATKTAMRWTGRAKPKRPSKCRPRGGQGSRSTGTQRKLMVDLGLRYIYVYVYVHIYYGLQSIWISMCIIYIYTHIHTVSMLPWFAIQQRNNCGGPCFFEGKAVVFRVFFRNKEGDVAWYV